MVRVHEHKEVVMVVEVFQEEIEETNRVYKPVLFKINEKNRNESS